MLFKRSFRLTRSFFILYVHERDHLGFGMLTLKTAVIPGLYLIAFVDLVFQSQYKRAVLSSQILFGIRGRVLLGQDP